MLEKRGNRTWYRAVKSFYKLGKKGRIVHVVAGMAACLTLTLSTPCLAGTVTTIAGSVYTTQTLESQDSAIIVTKDGSIIVNDSDGIDASVGLDGTIVDLYCGYIKNAGTIQITNSAAADLEGIDASDVTEGSTIENSGTIQIDNSATDAYLTGISAFSLNYWSTIENAGTIQIDNSATDADLTGIAVNTVETGSTIKNSGTIQIDNSGNDAELTGISARYLAGATMENSGDIEVTSSTLCAATGIQAYAISGTSQITNSGTISLTSSFDTDTLTSVYDLRFAGISNYGHNDNDASAVITNTGSITIDVDTASLAIGIDNGGLASVINGGTISVSADSAMEVVGILNAKTGSVTNSGTISVSAGTDEITLNGIGFSAMGIGIASYGDVTNSGTITAALDNGDLSESFWSVQTTGCLTNSGTLNGRLSAGDTTNSGTIQLSPGVSSISGNFTQESTGILGITLDTDDSDNAEYSTLEVTGTATLADNSGIYVDVIATDDSVLVGQTLTGVIEATTIDVNIDTLDITDNSYLLDFIASLSSLDTSLDLTAEQALLIADAVQQSGQSGVAGAAAVLDNLSNTSDPEITAFIANLNTLSTAGKVAAQVAQVAPVTAAQTPVVAGQVLNTMSSVIQGRQGSQGGPTGLNSGDAVFSDKNLWIKSFAAVMDQEDSNQANGFSADVYGVGMGMDGEIASGDQLGLSLFYTRAQTDTNNLDQESDMDMVSLMAYGSRDLTPDKDITLYWQAGAGIQDTESSRYISSLDSNAQAQYTATNLFAQTRAVRAFQLRENLMLTGGAVISYTWIHTPSYSESGAGGMNLSVDSNNTQALVPGLEGGLSWGLPKDVKITARVALGYDLINDDASVTAIFQGAGTAFTTQGVDNSPVVFGAGVGISKKLTQRLSLDASYDLEGQGSDFVSHMVSCKLNWTL